MEKPKQKLENQMKNPQLVIATWLLNNRVDVMPGATPFGVWLFDNIWFGAN